MKLEDLKDSSDFAEALGLLASLIAAILALGNAQKESTDDGQNPTDSECPPASVKVLDGLGHKAVGHSKLSIFLQKHAVAFLGVIVVLQFIFILFIAYRLM